MAKVKFTFSHPVHLSKAKPEVIEITHDHSQAKDTHNSEIQDWMHILMAGLTKIPRGEVDWIKIEKIKIR